MDQDNGSSYLSNDQVKKKKKKNLEQILTEGSTMTQSASTLDWMLEGEEAL